MVPKSSPTEITYLICETCPLSERIFENPTRALESINLSIPFPGHQLALVRNKPKQEEAFSFQEEVPEKFWEILQSQVKLPTDKDLRKRFTSKLYDLKHRYQCRRNLSDFHNHADIRKCKCKNCNNPMDWYHEC